MRAIEMKTMFAGVNYDAERNYQLHRKRLREIKKCVDNDLPSSYEIRSKSPNKRSVGNKQAAKEKIYRDNFFLAKRIFDIMEGESPLSEMINDTKHLDNHPGTMNFKVRLEEAQRIHYENMLLASRLNSVEPHYKNDELSVVRSVVPEKTPRTISPRSKKTRFLRELEYTLRMASPAGRQRASQGYDQHGWSPNQLGAMTPEDGELTNRDDQMNENNVLRDQELKLSGRPRSIVLEYTKVQNGRVLDIAVVKEPYRDSYIIYGKDIEDGQRFELQLTSEDVSNILDGDILVTSVDNVEVWMALLHKVELEEVEQFSKIVQVPPPPEAEYSLIQDDAPPPQRAPHRVPNAPEAFLRPSGEVPRGVGGKGNRRGKNSHNAHRVIREKGRGRGEVDAPVMSEVDKNLSKVEEAAKKRLKAMNNHQPGNQPPNNSKKTAVLVPALPLNKIGKEVVNEQTVPEQVVVEDNTPAIEPPEVSTPAASSRTVPETEIVTITYSSPSKRVSSPKEKSNSKSNSPRQTVIRGSFEAYTTPPQPVRKSINLTKPDHSIATSNMSMKPKPPSKPSSSYPAVQPNQPNGSNGNKRPNNYKTRAATIDKSDAVTHQIIPRAIAQAVSAVENDDFSTASTARAGGSQKSKAAMQSNSIDFELEAEAVLAVEETTNFEELSTASEPFQLTVQTVVDNALQSALANMAKYAIDSLIAVKAPRKVEVEEELFEPLPQPELKVEAEVLPVIDAPITADEEEEEELIERQVPPVPANTVDYYETPIYGSASASTKMKGTEKEVPPVPANTVDHHDSSVAVSASTSAKMKVATTSLFPSIAVDKTTPASPLYRQLNPAFFPSKSTSEVVLSAPSRSMKSERGKDVNDVEEEEVERVPAPAALASTSHDTRAAKEVDEVEEEEIERVSAPPGVALTSTSYDTRGAKEVDEVEEEEVERTSVTPSVEVKSASLDAKYDMAEDVSLSNGHDDSYSKEAFDEVRDEAASRTKLVSRAKSRASGEVALDDSYSKEAFDEIPPATSVSRAKLASRAKSRASGEDVLDESYNDDFESSQ